MIFFKHIYLTLQYINNLILYTQQYNLLFTPSKIVESFSFLPQGEVYTNIRQHSCQPSQSPSVSQHHIRCTTVHMETTISEQYRVPSEPCGVLEKLKLSSFGKIDTQFDQIYSELINILFKDHKYCCGSGENTMAYIEVKCVVRFRIRTSKEHTN